MEREKRTLMNRLERNFKRMFTRPFKKRKPPVLLEEDVVDLMEFTGLRRAEVVAYLSRTGGRRISDELDWLRPTSREEYTWFYRGSRTYLFVVGEAWDRALQTAQPGWKTLDFGGGGGRNTIALAEQGCRAHYVDIGVQSGAFVEFRARKRGLDVTVLDPLVEVDGAWRVDTAEAARREGGFDLIVCDNVLEHVPDYDAVLATLAAALRPGGKILECTPWKREKTYLFKRAPEWDVHLLPKTRMEDAMAACGMARVEGAEDGLWEKVGAASSSSV